MKSLSAHGSIHLNRRMGGKFPHLTVCAEAWILDYRVRVFFLDLLMIILFWELNHCRNQYLTYGVANGLHRIHHHRGTCSDSDSSSSFS